MDDQFTRSYSILNLRPGAGWDELRSAYRSLVKTWHPDRFQSDSERRRAEEKTKEITRAYKTLADYYRKHGQMPADSDSPVADAEIPATTAHTDQAVAEPVNVASVAERTTHSPDATTARPPIDWKTIAALIAAALLIYLWLLDDPSENESVSGALAGDQVIDAPHAGSIGNAAPQSAGRLFTRGSKIGDVYSIQGIPTKTENEIWHYGKSKVYFANGSVTRWESHLENPLRASLDVEPTIHNKEFFTQGSTKSEVMSLHGTPWRQTEHEWAYGPSRIFFADGLVTGWEESPLHPLKARK
jgi:hypothetical protein